jgi:hypothetical protein
VSLSVGVGALAVAGGVAALAAGVGLYAAGKQITTGAGVTKGRTVRLIQEGTPDTTTVSTVMMPNPLYVSGVSDPKNKFVPMEHTVVVPGRPGKWAVYNERNVPIKYVSGTPTEENVISPSDRARGWTVDRLEKRGDIYMLTVKNASRRTIGTADRKKSADVLGTITGGLL